MYTASTTMCTASTIRRQRGGVLIWRQQGCRIRKFIQSSWSTRKPPRMRFIAYKYYSCSEPTTYRLQILNSVYHDASYGERRDQRNLPSPGRYECNQTFKPYARLHSRRQALRLKRIAALKESMQAITISVAQTVAIYGVVGRPTQHSVSRYVEQSAVGGAQAGSHFSCHNPKYLGNFNWVGNMSKLWVYMLAVVLPRRSLLWKCY